MAIVEQRHLEGAAFEESADRGGAECGDPVEPSRLEVREYAGFGDHAAVADQHDMVEAEAPFQLGDLIAERGRVAGRALEDLDGDRAAIGRTEQAVDDLQLALLAVAVVAELGERAAASLHEARRHVVEDQRAAGEMALGQRRLDRRLAHRQPIERGVELLLVDRPEAEFGAEARSGGPAPEPAPPPQLRARIERPAAGNPPHTPPPPLPPPPA